MQSYTCLAILALATLAASQSHAAVQVIETESTNERCIDVVPFDDDFGWNGNCSCRLSSNNEYIDFGESMYTSDSTLFVTAGESPLACADTGSVTVYEIQNNGTLQKQAEILPSDLRKGSAFEVGATAKDLVSLYEYSSSSITVHGRIGGSWRELYSVADAEGISSRFSHIFIDNELLLVSTNGIDRYEATTGNYLGNIPIVDPQIAGCDYYPTISKMGDFMVVTQNASSNVFQCGASVFTLDNFRYNNHVSLYEKENTGNWSLMFTHIDLGGLSSVKENEIVFSYHENSVPQPQTFDRTAYTRDINGSWMRQPTVTVSLSSIEWNTLNAEYFFVDEGARFYGTIPTGENFGIVRPWRDSDPTPDTVDLKFYQLINGSSLNLAQEISFPFPSRRTTTRYADDHLLVMAKDHSARTLTTNTLNRDGNGEWKILFGESITLGAPSRNAAGGASAMINDHGFRASDNRLYHFYPAGSNSSAENNCDYTDADLYGGWGWDATANQSCEPLTNIDPAVTPVSTVQCIDSDDDGYGWNGTATCIPGPPLTVTTEGNCDYSNADIYGGWGWDSIARQSCAPLDNVVVTQPTVQCIDTDGDGWGWDGSASCIP